MKSKAQLPAAAPPVASGIGGPEAANGLSLASFIDGLCSQMMNAGARRRQGAAGYNAAQVILADLGLAADWAPPPIAGRLAEL
jgi:hypothetical protein